MGLVSYIKLITECCFSPCQADERDVVLAKGKTNLLDTPPEG
jgi:hypothetical protein